MTYTLKKGMENFQVVDGPFAGRKFVRGKVYGEVPPQEENRFEEIKPIEAKRKSSPLTVDRSPKKKEQTTDNTTGGS